MPWVLIVVAVVVFGPMLVLGFASVVRHRAMSVSEMMDEQMAAAEASRRMTEIALASPVDVVTPHNDGGMGTPLV